MGRPRGHRQGRPASRSSDRAYQGLIFLTGAVTLSLELLASRIMTPYFGVSLYIWAGILSITLVSLAADYRVGACCRKPRTRRPVSTCCWPRRWSRR